MNPWRCCRTCLSEQNLNPIFPVLGDCEKYSNAIFAAVGLKINRNDNLPQAMCTPCIIFLNEINDFRKRCRETAKVLETRLIKNDYSETMTDIKPEEEKYFTINKLDDINDQNHDISDNEDNIPLGRLQRRNSVEDTKVLKLDILNCSNNESNLLSQVKTKSKTKTKTENTEKKEKANKERVKERIECEHCHKILTSRTSLRNHYKIHIGFDVVCEHCGKKFISKRLLLMHCKAKHGYEKTDKCSFCDYTASNAEQVKIHERLHTGEKPYACAACGARFHRRSSLLQHEATHLPHRTVQCDVCPALFKSATLMRIHRNRHRAPAHHFTCELCARSFVRRRNAARHVKRAHGLASNGEHVRRVAAGL